MLSLNRLAVTGAALVVAVCAAACGSSGTAGDGNTAAACSDLHVDRFKELIVVEPAVLADSRAQNATAGVWSFRHAIENLAPAGADTSAFVTAWLEDWVQTKDVNGFALDRAGEPRDAEMNHRIICPWLQRSPANACDDTCGVCTSRTLDLSLAPFRLIAIANRMDLRNEVEGEDAGEGRLIFSATNGSADDPASTPIPMTVIFEYALPKTRTTKEWATAWHGLGEVPGYDEPFRAALEGVTNGFTKRGANPSAQGGSALAQIRTNESALNWIWQLREFAVDASGALRLRALRNTPAAPLNNSKQLRDYVVANAASIKSKRFEMPLALRGGSADQLLFSWSLPDVDEPTRKAFAANTCNGCHSAENPSVDTVFHVSPFRQGVAKLSPFMNDPGGKADELTARTKSLQSALCGN